MSSVSEKEGKIFHFLKKIMNQTARGLFPEDLKAFCSSLSKPEQLLAMQYVDKW